MNEQPNVNVPLTWDELATEYDKVHSGCPARALFHQVVWDWAESQPDKFYVDPASGTIHRVVNSQPDLLKEARSNLAEVIELGTRIRKEAAYQDPFDEDYTRALLDEWDALILKISDSSQVPPEIPDGI